MNWGEGPVAQFIGLNPSTADETNDDPTIRRCKDFARRLGAGGMAMTNLFAYRSTDPAALKRTSHPIGEEGLYLSVAGHEFNNRNDFWLWTTASGCLWRIACWGTKGTYLYRNVKVKQLIPGLLCLSKTKDGHPEHPLYLKSSLQPIPFT